jgi:hypothetical protein
MIVARSVVPPESSFVKLLKRYKICCKMRAVGYIANTKDFVCEFLILVRGFDDNVDSSVSLNRDLVFACPPGSAVLKSRKRVISLKI